ncbi:MAG TPA: hypothetical protein VI728_08910 [Syntrophales bacterium]|nr:hypothetical protein [Syntrophales bacterium]
MAIEYKTPEVDIENKMLEDVLNTLQPKDVVIIDTDHCKTPEEEEFEIYAALLRHGRSKEDAARIAKAMAWDDEQ